LNAYKSMMAARPASPTTPLAAIVAIGAPAWELELEAPVAALLALEARELAAEEADDATEDADSDAWEATLEALLAAELALSEAEEAPLLAPLAPEVMVLVKVLPAESTPVVMTPKMV
jgi:hypothetical protein